MWVLSNLSSNTFQHCDSTLHSCLYLISCHYHLSCSLLPSGLSHRRSGTRQHLHLILSCVCPSRGHPRPLPLLPCFVDSPSSTGVSSRNPLLSRNFVVFSTRCSLCGPPVTSLRMLLFLSSGSSIADRFFLFQPHFHIDEIFGVERSWMQELRQDVASPACSLWVDTSRHHSPSFPTVAVCWVLHEVERLSAAQLSE